MSSKERSCDFQEQKEKTQTRQNDGNDLTSFSVLKCKDEGGNDSKCHLSSELNYLDCNFPPFSIKREPEDSQSQFVFQVQTENVTVKEEIDIEDHKLGWDLKGSKDAGNITEERRTYNCAHCPFKTNWRVAFIRHYIHIHKQGTEMYKCQECSLETKYKRYLTQHYKNKHLKEADLYKCLKCSYETRIKGNLTYHYKYKHATDVEVHKCQECSYETRRKSTLTRHYKCKHSKHGEVYRCEECSYETKRKDSLTKHYRCKHPK